MRVNKKLRQVVKYLNLNAIFYYEALDTKAFLLKGYHLTTEKGVIPNDKGQVVEIDGTHVEDTYVTGWIKRGPSGVIGTNRSDSIETVGTCLGTLEKTTIKDATDILTVFNEKNIKFLTYEDWKNN